MLKLIHFQETGLSFPNKLSFLSIMIHGKITIKEA